MKPNEKQQLKDGQEEPAGQQHNNHHGKDHHESSNSEQREKSCHENYGFEDETVPTSKTNNNVHDERLRSSNNKDPPKPSTTLSENVAKTNFNDVESGQKLPVNNGSEIELVNMSLNGSKGSQQQQHPDKSNGNLYVTSKLTDGGKDEKGRPLMDTPPLTDYFIPVNTHRKLLRGEKLYVTKDRRSRNSKRWRKAIICGIVWTFVAIVCVMAALAATGIIIISNPEADSTSTVNNFSELSSSSNEPTDFSQELLTVGTSIQPTMHPTVSMLDPSLRNIEGNMQITNLKYEDALADPNSLQFQALSTRLENKLFEVFNALSVWSIKINGFRPGSVWVDFSLGWNAANLNHTLPEIENHFHGYLDTTDWFLKEYKINQSSLVLSDFAYPTPPASIHEETPPTFFHNDNSLFDHEHRESTTTEEDGETRFDDEVTTSSPVAETLRTEKTTQTQFPWYLYGFTTEVTTERRASEGATRNTNYWRALDDWNTSYETTTETPRTTTEITTTHESTSEEHSTSDEIAELWTPPSRTTTTERVDEIHDVNGTSLFDFTTDSVHPDLATKIDDESSETTVSGATTASENSTRSISSDDVSVIVGERDNGTVNVTDRGNVSSTSEVPTSEITPTSTFETFVFDSDNMTLSEKASDKEINGTSNATDNTDILATSEMPTDVDVVGAEVTNGTESTVENNMTEPTLNKTNTSTIYNITLTNVTAENDSVSGILNFSSFRPFNESVTEVMLSSNDSTNLTTTMNFNGTSVETTTAFATEITTKSSELFSNVFLHDAFAENGTLSTLSNDSVWVNISDATANFDNESRITESISTVEPPVFSNATKFTNHVTEGKTLSNVTTPVDSELLNGTSQNFLLNDSSTFNVWPKFFANHTDVPENETSVASNATTNVSAAHDNTTEETTARLPEATNATTENLALVLNATTDDSAGNPLSVLTLKMNSTVANDREAKMMNDSSTFYANGTVVVNDDVVTESFDVVGNVSTAEGNANSTELVGREDLFALANKTNVTASGNSSDLNASETTEKSAEIATKLFANETASVDDAASSTAPSDIPNVSVTTETGVEITNEARANATADLNVQNASTTTEITNNARSNTTVTFLADFDVQNVSATTETDAEITNKTRSNTTESSLADLNVQNVLETGAEMTNKTRSSVTEISPTDFNVQNVSATTESNVEITTGILSVIGMQNASSTAEENLPTSTFSNSFPQNGLTETIVKNATADVVEQGPTTFNVLDVVTQSTANTTSNSGDDGVKVTSLPRTVENASTAADNKNVAETNTTSDIPSSTATIITKSNFNETRSPHNRVYFSMADEDPANSAETVPFGGGLELNITVTINGTTTTPSMDVETTTPPSSSVEEAEIISGTASVVVVTTSAAETTTTPMPSTAEITDNTGDEENMMETEETKSTGPTSIETTRSAPVVLTERNATDVTTGTPSHALNENLFDEVTYSFDKTPDEVLTTPLPNEGKSTEAASGGSTIERGGTLTTESETTTTVSSTEAESEAAPSNAAEQEKNYYDLEGSDETMTTSTVASSSAPTSETPSDRLHVEYNVGLSSDPRISNASTTTADHLSKANEVVDQSHPQTKTSTVSTTEESPNGRDNTTEAEISGTTIDKNTFVTTVATSDSTGNNNNNNTLTSTTNTRTAEHPNEIDDENVKHNASSHKSYSNILDKDGVAAKDDEVAREITYGDNTS